MSDATPDHADSFDHESEGLERPEGGNAGPPNAVALAMFDAKLAAIARDQTNLIGRRNMWLAHHWPDEYAERCVTIGSRHVCRRCAALYPLGVLIAIVSATVSPPWPTSIDPWPIWLLSIPATVAYCGEAAGIFRYNARVQVATMLIAAIAFGRGLGYEFEQRWSSEFWGPIIVFGGIWFFATMVGKTRADAAATAEARRRVIEQLEPAGTEARTTPRRR